MSIPVPATPLIGREAEVARLVEMVRRPGARLVTLHGPGGVGKTRVAIEAAAEIAGAGQHATIFVDLDSAQSADHVLTAIGVAAGVRETGEESHLQRVVAALAGSPTLLVLDTFERVIDAAELVSHLIRAVPNLTVLVTSREVLNLSLEQVLPLAPFARSNDRPELSNDPATRLFVERAAADGVSIPDEALPVVAAICDRLEGLPLAIELAAARCRVLSPSSLLERLDQRLTLLDAGPRDAPGRHRTIRNAIQWSYELLDPHEQRLFRAVSVFAGGAPTHLLESLLDRVNARSGANELSGSPLAMLGSLVDKSLIVRKGGDSAEPRLTMLDTVREFASEQLAAAGERDAAKWDHAYVLIEWGERIKPHMFSADQAQWLDRAEAELGNIRTALQWAIEERDAEGAARLMAAFMPIFLKRGHFAEGRSWCESILTLGGEIPAATGIILHFGASSLAQAVGDHQDAMALANAGLPIASAADDSLGLGILLLVKASVCFEVGDLHEARETAEAARQMLIGFPGRFQLAGVLRLLTDIALVTGDDSQAQSYFAAARNTARQSGDQWEIAACLLQQVKVELRAGNRADALDLVRSAATSWRSLGDPAGVGVSVRTAALVISELGDELTAVRWSGAAVACLERINATPSVVDLADRDRIWQRAVLKYGENVVQDAWSRGRAEVLESVCGEIQTYAVPDMPVLGTTDPVKDALTSREREVLELVALGKTNKDIGAALYISHRTAGAHIVNILNKLGVDSRAAAAAWAIRSGIL